MKKSVKRKKYSSKKDSRRIFRKENLMPKKKKSLVGWIVRGILSRNYFKFQRGDYMSSHDKCSICITRGNPNSHNYTKNNHWQKVRITIEEI